MITLETKLGTINGNDFSDYNEYLGIPFARAGRFEYPVPVDKWNGIINATTFGPGCPQTRTWFQHLENPDRLFYYKEFRQGDMFTYDENCLNLNIYTPKNAVNCPVLIFIHGGGFNSGSNAENEFSGVNFAKLGIVTVVINYRVGIFGYLTHKDIMAKYGFDGNFGLYDQFEAIKWVNRHISDFGGDNTNITVIGQSAGAMSIQYLCCSQRCKGLFKNAVMMSGGGKFPDFSLPRFPEQTHEYWESFIQACGLNSLAELKELPAEKIFTVMEDFKLKHKDNSYNTMPVIDGMLLTEPIKKAIKTPLKINYLLGYTNCDMFAPALAFVSHKYSRRNNAYLYFFDVNPKGNDNKKAFHSSDLRYMFGTLHKSWRPYEEEDYKIAEIMQSYIVNFVKTGNPNGKGIDGTELPVWKSGSSKALHFAESLTLKMVRAPYFRLLKNMLTSSKQI